MKTLKVYFIFSILASLFVSCDLFFPYSLEDAPPRDTTNIDPPATDTTHTRPANLYVFSIDRNETYIRFSLGNLQYNANLDVWRFAPNQYDYIGDENEKISSSYNGWIDLFGWGTGDSPTKKSLSYSDYTNFTDWGNNKIGNDAEGTWRTLNSTEWEYLIYGRANASSLQGLGSINGVRGIILLPDKWERPSGVTFNSGFGDGFYQNEYSIEKWKLMESAGAVFLPAAGYRNGTSYYSGTGHYWSKSYDYYYGSQYHYFYFTQRGSSMICNDQGNAYKGYSVRLVNEIY